MRRSAVAAAPKRGRRPVCAIAWNGRRKTFGSRCLAEAEHAHIRHDGACRRGHWR